jgi:hypothetical protein
MNVQEFPNFELFDHMPSRPAELRWCRPVVSAVGCIVLFPTDDGVPPGWIAGDFT